MRVIGRSTVACYRNGRRARDKLFSLASAGAFASFGARSVIQLPVRLHGAQNIDIGAGVFLGAGSWLQTLDRGRVTIGDGCSFAGNCTIAALDRVTIGDHALFARGVYIADFGHNYSAPDVAIIDQGVTACGPVEIGEGAWLGQNVVVMPGVRIGRNAVIGSNAVVRKDVPDFGVAVGVPAVVKRIGPDPRSAGVSGAVDGHAV